MDFYLSIAGNPLKSTLSVASLFPDQGCTWPVNEVPGAAVHRRVSVSKIKTKFNITNRVSHQLFIYIFPLSDLDYLWASVGLYLRF